MRVEGMEITRVWMAAQVAEVAMLAREIWNEHYVPIIGQAQVDYMLEAFQSERAIEAQMADGHAYYVVTQGAAPAGYMALVPDAAASALLLSKLYVRKEARGRGLARGLLAVAEGACREGQRGILWLTVNRNNASSIAWYTRAGFQITGRVVRDIGGGFVMDDYRMEKAVPGVRGGGEPRKGRLPKREGEVGG